MSALTFFLFPVFSTRKKRDHSIFLAVMLPAWPTAGCSVRSDSVEGLGVGLLLCWMLGGLVPQELLFGG